VMFTTLFYGWGFGQLFLLGPAVTTFYAALFFVALLMFCTWWLARYRLVLLNGFGAALPI
jgi:uncharacterized membrane protein YeiB